MKKVLSVLLTVALVGQLLVMFGTVCAEGASSLTVSNVSGTVGTTVTVDVGIANNPGFHALQCEIVYDTTRLKLVGIAHADSLIPDPSLAIDDYFVSSAETATFIYRGVDLDESTMQLVSHLVSGDVTVAKLTFELLASGESSVAVNCTASVKLDDSYPDGMNVFNTSSAYGMVNIVEKPAYTVGDVNGSNFVDSDDAIYLLMYTIFPNDYPINQGADFNGSGFVDSDDAIYLLMYTIFPNDYPLS